MLDDLVEDCENSSINWILQDASCWHVNEWSQSPGICFKIPDRLEALIITGAGAVAFSKEIRDLTLQSFSELDMDGMVPRIWRRI